MLLTWLFLFVFYLSFFFWGMWNTCWLFCPTGQWKRFPLVRGPWVPPKPDPSPEEAALPCRACLLHTACLPTQVTSSAVHAMSRCVCGVFFGKTQNLIRGVCLSFGAVPLHPLVISFYKAARSKVRPDESSLHFWGHPVLCTRLFAVFWSRCLGTFSIIALLSPILGLTCLLSIIDASWTTIMFSAPGDASAFSCSPPCLSDL